MKREERKAYNSLRKEVTTDTINVEISVEWTHEARQAIHELLTIEKHMRATMICWNSIQNCNVVHYAPCYDECAEEQRKAQENMDIIDLSVMLPISNRTWNGFEKPTEEAQEATEETTDSKKPTEAKENSFEIRQLDAWGNAEEGYEINESWLLGTMATKAQNERKAFTDWLRKHCGIIFKKNRTLIEFDGDCYTIIDRKTKEPLFIAIPSC